MFGRHDDTSHRGLCPLSAKDGLEVRQATWTSEPTTPPRVCAAERRWEHPFPRTGRVLHAPDRIIERWKV